MKGVSNRLGERMLSKIGHGRVKVTWPDGKERCYGSEPGLSAHLQLHRDGEPFRSALLYGDIGFAESYMAGDFDADDLTALISIALLNSSELGIKSEDEGGRLVNLLPFLNRIGHRLRPNSKRLARENISKHYDLSNELFRLFLDESMMYSSAIFEQNTATLFEAQQAKVSHLARKLRLKPGARVLEIGSGWGFMAMHLAEQYDCHVTTLTLSKEQKAYCEERIERAGLSDRIEVRLEDYRDVEGRFDAIISIEMFEAVGRQYFRAFFERCQSLLHTGGLLVMQVITIPDQRYRAYCKSADFIQKYVFPGGHLPSLHKIGETTSRYTRFNLLHAEEFSEDYARTLQIWHENFLANLDAVRSLGFDDLFIRMWRLYLSYCEAGFLTRNIHLMQLVFSPDANMELNRGLISR